MYSQRVWAPTPQPLNTIPYLAESWFLAELGNGLVKFRLLLRKVLLVEPQQLLALPVLLLHAWRPRVKKLTKLNNK